MLGRTLLLDANLLVLFTVGAASKDYIEKHKRLRAYTVRDYDLLCKAFIRIARQVIVTPNTVTEASNLIRQIADPARTHIARVFRDILNGVFEISVASQAAAASDA